MNSFRSQVTRRITPIAQARFDALCANADRVTEKDYRYLPPSAGSRPLIRSAWLGDSVIAMGYYFAGATGTIGGSFYDIEKVVSH